MLDQLVKINKSCHLTCVNTTAICVLYTALIFVLSSKGRDFNLPFRRTSMTKGGIYVAYTPDMDTNYEYDIHKQVDTGVGT